VGRSPRCVRRAPPHRLCHRPLLRQDLDPPGSRSAPRSTKTGPRFGLTSGSPPDRGGRAWCVRRIIASRVKRCFSQESRIRFGFPSDGKVVPFVPRGPNEPQPVPSERTDSSGSVDPSHLWSVWGTMSAASPEDQRRETPRATVPANRSALRVPSGTAGRTGGIGCGARPIAETPAHEGSTIAVLCRRARQPRARCARER
jgi:hypothetical protein